MPCLLPHRHQVAVPITQRRIAPLSRFLAGIILSYESYGSHLNSQGVTIDAAREKSNFERAGETLAEVWNEAIIDQFPVLAEWRGGVRADTPAYPSQAWLAMHVRASQYFLQIVKCDDEECCAAPTSSLKTILQDRFFPAPLPVVNTEGISISDSNNSEGKFLNLFQRLSIHFMSAGLPARKDCPYDLCCPTLKSALEKRTCNICNLYFPSQVMVRAHKTALHPRIKINDIPKIRPIRVAARRPWALNIFCFILGGNFDDCGFWRVETWHNQNPLCLPRISAI